MSHEPPVLPSSSEQKLVTIYLENTAYAKGRTLVGSYADRHGYVEEHLKEDLQAGWRISQMTALGGHDNVVTARGWLAVVLTRSS